MGTKKMNDGNDRLDAALDAANKAIKDAAELNDNPPAAAKAWAVASNAWAIVASITGTPEAIRAPESCRLASDAFSKAGKEAR